jgi:hypothetical protein
MYWKIIPGSLCPAGRGGRATSDIPPQVIGPQTLEDSGPRRRCRAPAAVLHPLSLVLHLSIHSGRFSPHSHRPLRLRCLPQGIAFRPVRLVYVPCQLGLAMGAVRPGAGQVLDCEADPGKPARRVRFPVFRRAANGLRRLLPPGKCSGYGGSGHETVFLDFWLFFWQFVGMTVHFLARGEVPRRRGQAVAECFGCDPVV